MVKKFRKCKICKKRIKIFRKALGSKFSLWDSDEGVMYRDNLEIPSSGSAVWFCNECWRLILSNGKKDKFKI